MGKPDAHLVENLLDPLVRLPADHELLARLGDENERATFRFVSMLTTR
jgi:hypothetical protein